MKDKLDYSMTNENLDAITKAMDLRPNDIVLSILGSGDQALAILEKCQRVYAIDNNPAQINYFQRRIELLKKRDFKGFMKREKGVCDKGSGIEVDGYNPEKQREYLENYFSEERLSRISSKLDNLFLEEDEIQYRIFGGGFNKIYLSNCWVFLMDKTEDIPEDCLIYTSNGVPFSDGVKIDEKKTELARSYQGSWWKPTVLVKEGISK